MLYRIWNKNYILLLSLIFFTWGNTVAQSQEIKVVRHATESWGGYTDKDGTGIYHELLRAIYGEFGIKVEAQYLPLKRAVVMVNTGKADITGGFSRDDRNFAKYPIYETGFSALYHKSAIKSWEGAESLKGLRVVGPPETAKEFKIPMEEMESRVQAIRMLLKKRADAYVDLTPIARDFYNTGKMILSDQVETDEDRKFDFDKKDLVLSVVSQVQLFMVFSNNERGHKLREMYEEGTRRLHADGRLQALYTKYKLQTPTIE